MRVGSGPQRRYRPPAITLVALLDLPGKAREINTFSFFFQLLISALGTHLRARCQEDLEDGVGEHHGRHVAAVGDEPRRPPESALAGEQRLAHGGNPGDFRGAAPAHLAAYLVAYVLVLEQHLPVLEHHVHLRRELGKASYLQAADVARAAARRLGELLAGSVALRDPDDVFFATAGELLGSLPADLCERVAFRRERYERYRQLALPATWTGVPTPIPLASEADDSVGRLELRGLPASAGVVRGRARRVTDPATAKLEPDEILVCETTDPSWAALFVIAAGVVIDIGGAISHGAIVARELGLPAVINTGEAMRRLRTGDLIEVDGDQGVVRKPAISGSREIYLSPVELREPAPVAGDVVWLERGAPLEVGDARYTFTGFRMESGAEFLAYADLEVAKQGRTWRVSPAISAGPSGTRAVPAEVPSVGTIALARVDADRGLRDARTASPSPWRHRRPRCRCHGWSPFPATT